MCTGLSWTSDAPSELTDLVTSVTDDLMVSGLTERILGLVTTLDWTTDLAGLQRNAALGDAHHVSTIQLLHADIKQNLADIVYCYSSQSGLSARAATKLLEYLAKVYIS